MRSNRFKTHFMSGILVIAPAFCTILLVVYILRFFDVFLLAPLYRLVPFTPEGLFQVLLTKLSIGLGLVVTIALTGMLAEKFIFKRVFESGDQVMTSIPMLNRVYLTFKEIAQAVFGKKAGIFRKTVFVEYPRKGLWVIGFITQEGQWKLCDKTCRELIGVFLPTPPNPASGYLVFVPKEDIIDVDMTVEEGIRLTVSAGAVVPGVK